MAMLMKKLIFGLLGHEPNTPLIMTKDQIAKLLQVKVADINKAIKIGQLTAGRHYFLVNGEVRFHVSDDLFSRIMDDCLQAGRISWDIADKAKAQAPARTGKKRTTDNNQEHNVA
jgi:hypothetical protein